MQQDKAGNKLSQEHLTVKDLWESIQDGTKEIKHFLRLLYLKETNHISQMLQMLQKIFPYSVKENVKRMIKCFKILPEKNKKLQETLLQEMTTSNSLYNNVVKFKH